MPTKQKVDVAIVGAGFGGLCMGIKLQEAGFDNFVILEKADEVGGTWRDNNYPGCACDVQSHLYSYSFAGKADWSRRYSPWDEIENYIQDCTDKYKLREKIQFGKEVCGAHFDKDLGHWTINLADGNELVAKHWVLGTGPLHVPAIPEIPGLKDFKGTVFHSAQWDHNYDLKGKKVVSIGTGGSAIQYVPEIAPDVEQLHVFQRTPAWVIPRDERKYNLLEKGLFKRFDGLRRLHRARLYWTNESRVWPIFHPSLARGLQQLAKAFIRLQVKDKALAKKLTPDYTIGCKRVLISNKWYPTFNRDNVELVTDGIAEVRANSIVTTDGVEREADCIILGTGFVVDPRVYMKDFALTGLPGHDLREDWKDGPEAYLGISVSGYPNMYQLVGPNTGLGHNSIIFMIECQAEYIVKSLRFLEDSGVDYMDVKPKVQQAFNEEVQANLDGTVWTSGCQSWYAQGGTNFIIWPWSTWRYKQRTQDFNPREYRYVYCSKQATEASNKQADAEVITALAS